jgi:hypothetical protein
MKRITETTFQESYQNGIMSVDIDQNIVRVALYDRSPIIYRFDDEIKISDISRIKENHKLMEL